MLYSPRAPTTAQLAGESRAAAVLAHSAGWLAILLADHPGRIWAASALLFQVPACDRRFAHLWRHRQELARARHLRLVTRRRRKPNLDSPARIPGIPGGLLRAIW